MVVRDTEIQYAEETKYMGVILDRKLLGRRHLEDKYRQGIVIFWYVCTGNKLGPGFKTSDVEL